MEHVHRGMGVDVWIQSCGFDSSIVQKFAQNKIAWEDVKTIKKETLEQWGIPKDEEINKILICCEKVKIHESAKHLGTAKREQDAVNGVFHGFGVDLYEEDNLLKDEGKLFDIRDFKRCHEISDYPGLWIGSYASTKQKSYLQFHNITHILTVGSYMIPLHPNDFKYKIIEAMDIPNQNLLQYFKECHAFIEEGRKAGGVLVHCQAGVSRSSTIIISYIMKHAKGYQDSYKLVKRSRSIIEPNEGFEKQLLLFERMNFEVDVDHQQYKNLLARTGPYYVKSWFESE